MISCLDKNFAFIIWTVLRGQPVYKPLTIQTRKKKKKEIKALAQPPHRHLRGLLLPTPASGPTSGEVEEVDFDEEVNDDLGGTVHARDPNSAA